MKEHEPKSERWECPCGVVNRPHADSCRGCRTPRTQVEAYIEDPKPVIYKSKWKENTRRSFGWNVSPDVATKTAALAATFIAGATLFMILIGKAQYGYYSLVDVTLIGVLGFLIYKFKSRIACTLLMLFFLAGKIQQLYYGNYRTVFGVISLMLTYWIIRGVKGSFDYHKQKETIGSSE